MTSSAADDFLPPFRDSVASLVDALMAELQPGDRDAVAVAIDAGATLRLACNVAPAFSLALYVVVHEHPARPVLVASWPTPADPSPSDAQPPAVH